MNEVKVVLLHSYLRRLRITPELSERPSTLQKLSLGEENRVIHLLKETIHLLDINLIPDHCRVHMNLLDEILAKRSLIEPFSPFFELEINDQEMYQNCKVVHSNSDTV